MVNYVSKFSNNNIEYIIKDSAARSDISSLQTSKANDSDVVKLTGDQTISGIKSFTNIIARKNTGLDIDTNPSSNKYQTIQFVDKNDITYAAIRGEQSTDGKTTIGIQVKSRSTNSWSTTLLVGQTVDGTNYTQAPTPATSDNSTKIATTAYVNARVQLVSTLPASPISGVLYCIPES